MTTIQDNQNIGHYTFIELFAGIGGIRIGFSNASCKCIWANEYDEKAAKTYIMNFGDDELIIKDIRDIKTEDIPDFDILVAGFPCQPFSIAGVSKKNSLGKPNGFNDESQGTLFFEIIRILKEKQPQAFFLENVQNLKNHNHGETFNTIETELRNCGYSFFHQVISAKSLVPQNRTRVYMIGFKDESIEFKFPAIPDLKPRIGDILESNVPDKYTLTERLWEYLQNHAKKHKDQGHGFGFGLVDLNSYSRTLSARYYKDGAEILIPQDGKPPRRLTPKECSHLQGFPVSFIISVSDTQAYKQFGNSVAVPIIEYLAKAIVKTLDEKMNRIDPVINQAGETPCR